MTSNKDCRMYEQKYPDVDDLVVVKVKQIAEMGAYVELLEYGNIDGMILLSELSRRRIRSINKLIRVGRNEVVVVLRVDKEKGYIDLSKRRVSPEEIKKCEVKYTKSKAVHSILRHVAEVKHKDLEELYKNIGWPLYKKYGHAFDAFKRAILDPDEVLEGIEIEDEVREALLENCQRRLTPQPVKIRSDVEVTCFDYDGIESIKEGLKAGQAIGDEENPVTIRLLAPPLYVLTLTTLDKEKGVKILQSAVDAIEAKMKELNGNLVVKMKPRSVTEREDEELYDMMEELEKANREVDGDAESDDDQQDWEQS